MREFPAKILEVNPDLTFNTEIYLGFGQQINKQLQLQYNIQILTGHEENILNLFKTLLNKEVVIKVHPANADKIEPIPVQVEYTNSRGMHINLIFEMIALGFATVTSGYDKTNANVV